MGRIGAPGPRAGLPTRRWRGQPVRPDALPPLLVGCHAGPTGSVGAGFDVVVQFFTSRGFAVAAVDYAGSTGYGRDYRCSLWGHWGVADVRGLRSSGAVPGRRRPGGRHPDGRRGGERRWLTALNALAVAGEGICRRGLLVRGHATCSRPGGTTHDFEAHYTDRLVGPLPECRATYEARSPAHGRRDQRRRCCCSRALDDRVVPPAQTEPCAMRCVADGTRL